MRTWTPLEGPFHGFIITHNESISMADYFTVRDGKKVTYRPTVHYAYHPCDQAIMSMHEIAGKNLKQQKRQRLIVEEVTSGRDELGVLLMGHKKGAYWYGSQIDIHEARKLVPYNNATSIQVVAPVLSGIIWALENPDRGHRRSRRDGLRAQPRDLHALSWPGGRQVQRLDAVAGPRRTLPRRSRQVRSLAVQELPRGLKFSQMNEQLITSVAVALLPANAPFWGSKEDQTDHKPALAGTSLTAAIRPAGADP